MGTAFWSWRSSPVLTVLTGLELGRLRMSVGYGSQKKGRPLSPVEVGMLLRKARMHGVSLTDCAEAVQLHETSMLRFLRILDLPADLRHLIDWGSGKDFIGFSAAVEMMKLPDTEDQRVLGAAIMASKLNSKEVRQVAQLRLRSGHSVDRCVREILRMRPNIVRRYIFIGSVAPENIEELQTLTQLARDSMLRSSMEKVGIRSATGRLGVKFFTLVGDENFNSSMQEIGKRNIEKQIRFHISQSVTDATFSH